jgi:hypothetical protein
MAGRFVTLVAAADTELARWNAGAQEGQYTVVRDIELLERTLLSPVIQAAGEIARVIIDGGTSLDHFLRLASGLPGNFRGELLFIRRDGSGYLSTRELQTQRSVRTLTAPEVEVYLRWHGLPARPRSSYPAESTPTPPPQRPHKNRPK